MAFFCFCLRLPARLAIAMVSGYQLTLSPDHGPLKCCFPGGYCRFSPTCSEYAKHSLQKNGLIMAVPKVIYRIFRCNPWSRGGVDPA
jgi:hypothetical protein